MRRVATSGGPALPINRGLDNAAAVILDTQRLEQKFQRNVLKCRDLIEGEQSLYGTVREIVDGKVATPHERSETVLAPSIRTERNNTMYLGFSRFVTRLGRRHGVTAALVAAVSTLPLLAREAGAAAPSHVDCDRGDSLQAVFRPAGQGHATHPSLRPGAVILVSGTCNENVEVTDAFDGIVLDGQGTATINGPDVSRDTLRLISVENFTVRGFTITGGRDGINLRGVQMVSIQRNTIRAARGGTAFRSTGEASR
jgi:hypothetical protein